MKRKLRKNTDILKEEGHRLMDTYKELTGKNSDKAYADLKVRMRGKSWHFAQMTDSQTIKLAIGNLKKMIAHELYAKTTTSEE
jgi:hypothetical protein